MKRLKTSIKKGLGWIENMMLTYNRGSWGVYERLRTDENLRVSLCRPDTASEYLVALNDYYEVYGKKDKQDIYENIVKWLMYAQNDMDKDKNTAFNFFLIDGYKVYTNNSKLGKQLYPNDNGKVLINLSSLYIKTGDKRLLDMAEKSAEFWISIQTESGYFYDPIIVINQKNSSIPCMNLWIMAGMCTLYKATGKEKYLDSAKKVFNYVKSQLMLENRIMTSYEKGQCEDWRTVSSENYIALLCFAIGYQCTSDNEFLQYIDRIKEFCISLIDDSGAIKNYTNQTVNASLNIEPNLCDLVYTQGFALNALCAMYKITKDQVWLIRAKKLALFLASIQCNEKDGKVDGGWRGSYNLVTKKYAGRCNQNNLIDEGGIYSIYTGWCTIPILMGMLKVEKESKNK